MKQKIYDFIMNDWTLSTLFSLGLVLGIFLWG